MELAFNICAGVCNVVRKRGLVWGFTIITETIQTYLLLNIIVILKFEHMYLTAQ